MHKSNSRKKELHGLKKIKTKKKNYHIVNYKSWVENQKVSRDQTVKNCHCISTYSNLDKFIVEIECLLNSNAHHLLCILGYFILNQDALDEHHQLFVSYYAVNLNVLKKKKKVQYKIYHLSSTQIE